MQYFFTSDEHYAHKRIIKYCNRPFVSVEEMDAEIIRRHNERVKSNDLVIHCGDFTLRSSFEGANIFIKQLNGQHIFLKGSHDHWLDKRPNVHERWERKIEDIYIVADHYPGRSWPRSHYGSVQVFGHHHGNVSPVGRQWDVGVDNNDYYPVSFEELKSKINWSVDEYNRQGVLSRKAF